MVPLKRGPRRGGRPKDQAGPERVSICPFCRIVMAGEFLHSNGHAVAFLDAFPVSPGHMLIVPRRHMADFFSLSSVEQRAILSLVAHVKGALDQEYRPSGYNVGINAGPAAGQTVLHAHVHLIPRYAGDVIDPRGGVRWVLPERAPYWKQATD